MNDDILRIQGETYSGHGVDRGYFPSVQIGIKHSYFGQGSTLSKNEKSNYKKKTQRSLKNQKKTKA